MGVGSAGAHVRSEQANPVECMWFLSHSPGGKVRPAVWAESPSRGAFGCSVTEALGTFPSSPEIATELSDSMMQSQTLTCSQHLQVKQQDTPQVTRTGPSL